MAHRFFEPIRLNGIGIWDRSEDGEWRLVELQVQSVDLLEDETLSDVISKLRAAPVTWPIDADSILQSEREK